MKYHRLALTMVGIVAAFFGALGCDESASGAKDDLATVTSSHDTQSQEPTHSDDDTETTEATDTPSDTETVSATDSGSDDTQSDSEVGTDSQGGLTITVASTSYAEGRALRCVRFHERVLDSGEDGCHTPENFHASVYEGELLAGYVPTAVAEYPLAEPLSWQRETLPIDTRVEVLAVAFHATDGECDAGMERFEPVAALAFGCETITVDQSQLSVIDPFELVDVVEWNVLPVPPSGDYPAGRAYPAMAASGGPGEQVDATTVVMFGGAVAQDMGGYDLVWQNDETWLFEYNSPDDYSWTQVELSVEGPMARAAAAMSPAHWRAELPATAGVALFGGIWVGILAEFNALDDLWFFDPQTESWTPITAGPAAVWPAARFGHQFLVLPGTYTLGEDTLTDPLLLIGGVGIDGEGELIYRQDAWLLDLGLSPKWYEISPDGFEPRAAFGAAAVRAQDGPSEVFVFGGVGGELGTAGSEPFLSCALTQGKTFSCLSTCADPPFEDDTLSHLPLVAMGTTEEEELRLAAFGGIEQTGGEVSAITSNTREHEELVVGDAEGCLLETKLTNPSDQHPAARYAHGMTLLHDGNVFLYGGAGDVDASISGPVVMLPTLDGILGDAYLLDNP